MEIISPHATSAKEKLWIVLCHLSLFIGFPFLIPFIIYLVKKQESTRIAEHAREVLNFHLSFFFYGLLCAPLVFIVIGFFLLGLLALLAAVFSVIAAWQASEDKFFRYPLTIRLLK
jgi:uncharacterized protein